MSGSDFSCSVDLCVGSVLLLKVEGLEREEGRRMERERKWEEGREEKRRKRKRKGRM